MVAIIGGQPARFRPLIELYRHAGAKAGYKPNSSRWACIFSVCRRHDRAGGRRLLSRLRADVYKDWRRTRLGRASRAQFDATMGPEGAYVIGDPERVAEKLSHIHETWAV